LTEFFAGKVVLVTGGTGSIGEEIVAQLLKRDVRVIRVLSNDENSLFNTKMKFSDDRLRYLLGDVRDENRMKMAAREVDIVFHTAALKHVPLGEYNPFELVQTNVIGTQNAIAASLDENVKHFLLISSDKAVNPTSTLGASKLLCERLVIDGGAYVGRRETKFASIRFGNVIDSRGSVFELFQRQIQNLGPVTITNAQMTRFAFTAFRAVSHVLRAMEMMKGGEIFVPKMQALRVADLADVMIEELCTKYHLDRRQVRIQPTKPRPGEKSHEELMTSAEAQRSVEMGDMYVILPDTVELKGYEKYAPPEIRDYSSASAMPLMSREEILKLLRSLGLGS
jgi:FlaA1/EpsC-like NDP-sugar epimerase